MFNRAQLEEVVEISARAYRLLRWVSDAIERGFITFTRAHEYASDADAAAAWIAELHAQTILEAEAQVAHVLEKASLPRANPAKNRTRRNPASSDARARPRALHSAP